MPSLGLGLGTHIPSRVLSRLLLDQFGGAAAAYSLRKLSASTTNVVRVRRSSDNAEDDFTAAEVADGTLTTWVGAVDGFVRTWYDQSGNARDAGQATTTAQPQIVSSGSLVSGGIDFDGTNHGLDITGFAPLSTNYYLVAVMDFDTVPSSLKAIFDSTDSNNGGVALACGATSNKLTPYGYFDGITSPRVITGATDVGTGGRLMSGLFKSGSSACYLDGNSDGTLATTWTTAGTNSFTKSTIGYDQTNAGREINGQLAELIIYTTDQSANRAAIESNINDRYSIY